MPTRSDLSRALLDPIPLVISRRQVLASDTGSLLAILHGITDDPQRARAYLGRMVLVFDGWNEDPRELFEIEAVRAFVGKIDAGWPFWYAYLNQVDDVIQLIEACLAPTIEISPGLASIDTDALRRNLARHFGHLTMLFERYGWPEAELQRITDGVVGLFRNASIAHPHEEGFL